MSADLDERLRAADPARLLGPYDENRSRLVLEAARTHALATGPIATGPRRLKRPVALALAAAAVAGIFFAAPIVVSSRSHPTGASAAADSLLAKAAAVSVTDPVARRDQYWQITTVGRTLTTEHTDTGFNHWRQKVTTTRWVPLDESLPEWEWSTANRPGVQIAGSGSNVASPPPAFSQGSTSDLPASSVPGSWQTPNASFVAGLPVDPAALRDRVYADARGHGQSADGEAFVLIADALRSGRIPATMRARLLDLLRTVPGVDVTTEQAQIDGANGVGIGRTERSGVSRQEIVLDANTGQLIGEREVLWSASDGMPAGTVLNESHVTRSLVDTVPARVRRLAERTVCRAETSGAVTCTLPDALSKP